jgi:hypothetical protein
MLQELPVSTFREEDGGSSKTLVFLLLFIQLHGVTLEKTVT